MRRLIAPSLAISEAPVPILRAIEIACVVRIRADVVVGLAQGLVQYGQCLVSSGVLAHKFATDQDRLARTAIDDSTRKLRIDIDEFGLSFGDSLPGSGTTRLYLATALAQMRARSCQFGARWSCLCGEQTGQPIKKTLHGVTIILVRPQQVTLLT